MGSSFENVQVYIGSQDKKTAHQTIIDALDALVLRGDYAETEADHPDNADLTLIVSPVSDEAWISVYLYHEWGRCIPEEFLFPRLAQALSAEVSYPVVGILVHDSDVLRLDYYQGGALVDQFDNEWVMGYERSEAPPDRIRDGHPERWRDLLRPGTAPDALRAAWNKEEVFIEDRLTIMAFLLGMNSDLVQTYPQELVETDALDFFFMMYRRSPRKSA